MTLIQAYQINLPSLGPFVSGLASGTGISNNYYPAVGNPSGFITTGQTGQFQPSGNYYPASNPNGYISNFSGYSGLPAINYFGFTGLTISGNISYTGNLISGQGVFTTRINVLTGLNNNWTGIIVVGTGNAFPGAIARFNISLPSGSGYFIQVSGYNNGSSLLQNPLSVAGQTYMEFSYDGSAWRNDLWV